MINAGDLKHRLTFQSFVYGPQDDYGNPSKVWGTWKTLWGDIKPISGKEAMIAMQFSASVSHKIQVRYGVGFSPLMRIIFQGRTFSIQGIVDDGELGESMTIWATEVIQPAMALEGSQNDYNNMDEFGYNQLGE